MLQANTINTMHNESCERCTSFFNCARLVNALSCITLIMSPHTWSCDDCYRARRTSLGTISVFHRSARGPSGSRALSPRRSTLRTNADVTSTNVSCQTTWTTILRLSRATQLHNIKHISRSPLSTCIARTSRSMMYVVWAFAPGPVGREGSACSRFCARMLLSSLSLSLFLSLSLSLSLFSLLSSLFLSRLCTSSLRWSATLRPLLLELLQLLLLLALEDLALTAFAALA